MLLALARFLDGKDFPALAQPRWLQYPVSLVNYIPRGLREQIFARLGASEAVAPDKIGSVSADAIAEWIAGRYPQRRYPAVMIGSSSGTLVHLGAALGIPWLPQTFLLLVRHSGIDPDDAIRAMEAGELPARAFLNANPDVQLHHMHDPSQDRLMVRHASYFRGKFRRLPRAYRTWLRDYLEPNGTVIVVECTRAWLTTRVGERHLYQFGAVGGPTAEEYFHGSERVEAYLARYGSPRQRWQPPPSDGESPEAEWGFEPSLRDDIAALAGEQGCRIVRLVFDEPAHPSPAVADFYRRCYRARGLPADRLLIESFILLEPYWTFRIGAVPFWMTFNMRPSLDWARSYLERTDRFDCIHLMLFAHGVNSVGLPPIDDWRRLLALARRSGSFLGVDEVAYPAHFAVFASYHMDLRKLPASYPVPEPVPWADFARFLRGSQWRALLRLD
jgi:hypothetical protein